MRTCRRAKPKARGGSASPPKREAEGRASANRGDEKSKLLLRRADIEELRGQPSPQLLELRMS